MHLAQILQTAQHNTLQHDMVEGLSTKRSTT
jgi:hypothetical protein